MKKGLDEYAMYKFIYYLPLRLMAGVAAVFLFLVLREAVFGLPVPLVPASPPVALPTLMIGAGGLLLAVVLLLLRRR